MFYSSIENEKIKMIKKLNLKKYRDESNFFLVEGEHLVIEAFKSGYLEELLILEGESFSLDVKTSYVTKKVLTYISDLDSPQKVIGICKKLSCKGFNGNRILILDDIQDPGNLGTIIRSAVAFGVDTIVLSRGCVDLYNSKVVRASQGMIFYINIIVADLNELIFDLKKNEYKIYGTSVINGKNLKTIEKILKFAIIVGNEGNGVKKEILEQCDENIYIDMDKNCESLNVGIATSIILYEFDK